MSDECAIVRDILELYLAGKLSEQTREFAEHHLYHCEECSELLSKKASGLPIEMPSDTEQDKLEHKAEKLASFFIKNRGVIRAFVFAALCFAGGALSAGQGGLLSTVPLLVLVPVIYALAYGEIITLALGCAAAGVSAGLFFRGNPANMLVAVGAALVVAALSGAAGYAMRRSFTGEGKKTAAIAVFLIAAAVLSGCTWVYLYVCGNPVSYWQSRGHVREYIDNVYREHELSMGETVYDFGTKSYITYVHADSKLLPVVYKDGQITDGYADDIRNTYRHYYNGVISLIAARSQIYYGINVSSSPALTTGAYRYVDNDIIEAATARPFAQDEASKAVRSELYAGSKESSVLIRFIEDQSPSAALLTLTRSSFAASCRHIAVSLKNAGYSFKSITFECAGVGIDEGKKYTITASDGAAAEIDLLDIVISPLESNTQAGS